MVNCSMYNKEKIKMKLIDSNMKKVKDLYNSNNQNELIEKNANYFKMCVYADLNLGSPS